MSLANGGLSRLTADRIAPPGFDVSWAGGRPWPWTPGYCLGSEDGEILFTDADDVTYGARYEVSPSGESINGIAFAGDLMAASTRSDVTFLNVPRPGEGRIERAVFYGGAHGVATTQGGEIVAPMGRRGVLRMGPKQSKAQRIKILKPTDEALDFYRVVGLAAPGGGEVLACAARRSGFAVMPLTEGSAGDFGKRLRPEGVDFVDVAPLVTEAHPTSCVALGLDSSIYFIHDPSGEGMARRLRSAAIDERAYRILCARGHVFLLTNKHLYTFVDLATRLLSGETIDGSMFALKWEIEAVDISQAFDGSLLVVMPDSVYRIRIDSLIGGGGRAGQSGIPSRGNRETGMRPMDVNDSPWETSDNPAWKQSEELDLAVR